MNKLDFSHLLLIYRACEFDMDGRSATLSIDEKILEALKIALDPDNQEDSGLSGGFDVDKLAVGAVVRLSVAEPKIGLGYLAKNFSAFILMRRVVFVEPKNYFLIEEKFSRYDPNPPTIIARYRKVLELIKTLEKCAAYLDKDKEELVFINSGKYPVPIKYTGGELLNVEVSAIEKILKNFGVVDDSHAEQKVAILNEALLSTISGVSIGWRFKTILIEMAQVNEKFGDGYKLYLANFSYEKVRNDLQTWKVDYTGKLHKAFADIQNQLLTIPVATVIVATQFKLASKGTQAIFLTNFAILIGSWIFSALLILLCLNQLTTLEVFNSEIKRQKEKMRTDYETVLSMKDFSSVFQSLEKRVERQKCIINIVLAVMFIGLALSSIFFWLLSKPYWQP